MKLQEITQDALFPESIFGNAPTRPHYDVKRRVLCVGHTVVKRFKVPARNQELILTAFEEEEWPSQLDDPLPPTARVDSKQRLHDAIVRLNRKQKQELLVFRGDGTGRGIIWEFRNCHQIDTRLPLDLVN